MTGGTPSFRCGLSTRPARNAHASFFCVVFAFLFSDVSISMGRRTAGAGSATWGPDSNVRSWILLGSLAVRGSVTSHLSQDEARISTPAMMRQMSGPRHSRCLDLRQWEAHCHPFDRYDLLIKIGDHWDGSTMRIELSTIPVCPCCSSQSILVPHPQDRASNCT